MFVAGIEIFFGFVVGSILLGLAVAAVMICYGLCVGFKEWIGKQVTGYKLRVALQDIAEFSAHKVTSPE